MANRDDVELLDLRMKKSCLFTCRNQVNREVFRYNDSCLVRSGVDVLLDFLERPGLSLIRRLKEDNCVGSRFERFIEWAFLIHNEIVILEIKDTWPL